MFIESIIKEYDLCLSCGEDSMEVLTGITVGNPTEKLSHTILLQCSFCGRLGRREYLEELQNRDLDVALYEYKNIE